MKTWVGHWEEDASGSHSPPDGASWWLDGRSTPACAKAPGNQDSDNIILIATEDNVTLDSAYTQIGGTSADGYSHELSTSDRGALLSITGFGGDPGTFLDWLWDYFTLWPEIDDSTVNHYLPDRDGTISLQWGVRWTCPIGSILDGPQQKQGRPRRRSRPVPYQPKIATDRESRNKYRQRVLTKVRRQMREAFERDEVYGEKKLWHQCQRWGLGRRNKDQWERLLDFGMRGQVRGPRRPTTTYGPLTFTDSDSTALTTHDSNWTVQTGSWSIDTNAAAADTAGMAYYTGFADDDMTVSQTLPTGGLFAGPAARCSSSALTYYVPEMISTTTTQLAKLVAGTRTFLASVTPNQSHDSARVMSIDVAGTSIQGDYGSSTASTTDSSISGIYNPGMAQRTSSSVPNHDNWTATDGVADTGGSQLTTLGVG